MLRRPLPLPISFISLILLSFFSLSAGAATFTVTNLDDSGSGSLRQAIVNANGSAGTDTIQFQTGLTGTITLTSGEIIIQDSLILAGSGISQLAISGNNTSRIFNIEFGAVIIESLILQDGFSTGNGGAIYNPYNNLLMVNNSTLAGNTAQAGGAIYNYSATLMVSNSTLSSNKANSNGGAIYNSGSGIVTVNDSTLSSNTANSNGGAIFSYLGTITVNNSILSGNKRLYKNSIT